jgi:hypothetical protein
MVLEISADWRNAMRLSAYITFTSILAFAGVAAGQQSQSDSLVAAARRAREEKTQQPKATRVWDNDNIPKRPDEITVLSDNTPQTPAVPGSSAPAASAKEAESTKDSSAGKKATLETDLASSKENLQTLQNDLDILKRKFALDQQSYYGKPNYATDKDDATSLSGEQDQIDAKQLEMGAAQQKIADLQSQLNALASSKPSDQ